MKSSDHKTSSVLRRYDIVSGNDFRAAARRLDAAEGYEKVTSRPKRAGEDGD